ncbi:MAG: hypothetical protein KZQ77_13295 [Candidatus Thiodiazotropha sp. (ex Notomyrtea botanica)]|nr:hypothetical protein [Candidatus Thiodiazotropha sp. (ex Notomyrtea botanica)]
MKLKKLFLVMSALTTAGLLTACGGGGGGSASTANATTSIGKIDGFGSIYVNGVKLTPPTPATTWTTNQPQTTVRLALA